MGHDLTRAVWNKPWKRLAVMTPLSGEGREMGGAGVCTRASRSDLMAGNIVRLGRGCSPKASKTVSKMGEALPQTASGRGCLQRRSGSHLAQLNIGEEHLGDREWPGIRMPRFLILMVALASSKRSGVVYKMWLWCFAGEWDARRGPRQEIVSASAHPHVNSTTRAAA